MKKSLIALAVAATTVAPMAASAAMLQAAGDQEGINLYGSFRPQFISVGSERIGDGGSRFGLKGNHDLGNGMSSFYRLERPFSTANARFPEGGRLAYAGLKGGFGMVSMGQQWTPYYNAVVSANDPFPTVGAHNWYDTFNSQGQTNRVGNNLTYALPGGLPIGGAIAFIVDGDTTDGAGEENAVDIVSLGLTAAAGPVDLGLGYNVVGSNTVGGDDISRFGLNAQANMGAFALGAMVESVDIGGDGSNTTPWSIIASVAGFTLQFADSDQVLDSTAIALMYTYKLSGNTRIQLAWEDQDDREDDIALLRWRVDF